MTTPAIPKGLGAVLAGLLVSGVASVPAAYAAPNANTPFPVFTGSAAPVPDQRLYDTIYQERYMGLPDANDKGYRAGSPIHFAEGLRGRLLLIHGTGDDNVHYQGTERLVNRLIELKKPFDMMVYPNRSHSISEGPGTSLHVYSAIARYIVEHLPAGPK